MTEFVSQAPLAFAAGLLSVFSPCVMPLMPAYLSLISGISVEEMQRGVADSALRWRVMRACLGFVSGFSVVFVLMGIGAVFGALNTMYSAVAARTREIATLRALGFGGGPAVVAVLVESTALALIGGAVGGIASYLAFNGYQAATLNWSSFTQVVFQFEVTPGLLIAGLVGSVLMGLIGGIFPALRAARIPVATALREL